jgi:hypothetical protein
MTQVRAAARTASRAEEPHATLVWIDSREAFVVHWPEGARSVEHLESDVPKHHKSTGMGQHDPGRSRYGRVLPQPPVEGRRLEHLARFVDEVARRVPADEDVVVLGPGTVREQLWRELSAADKRAHRARRLATRPSPPLTVPQLVATLRSEVGAEPKRKKIARRLPVMRERHEDDIDITEELEQTE